MKYNPLNKPYCPFIFFTLFFMKVTILGAQETPLNPALIPQLFESSAKSLSELRSSLPNDIDLWPDIQIKLRERHSSALGVPLQHHVSLVEYEILDTLPRRGYILKKIVFETSPDVLVPAHLYIPDKLKKPAPGVLCVHGHWNKAKNAPEVHTRCVFLAQRGFVVLSLDAIGSGERAYEGIAYHGRQLGYQALPMGMTLAGLQILDNRRAIDLLASLPEVDRTAIGVTGASGGGNQTFNLSILDPRVKAAVAVCFFGSYEGYLRGAHCACELVPGVLTYADEGLAASLIAPRSLMIIAAKEDRGAAFRIDDARKNAEIASTIYKMAEAEDHFQFVEFEGGHDYSRPMREKMVSFFEKHLKGIPPAESIHESDLDLLSPEDLQVFRDTSRLENSLYVPQITARRAIELTTEFQSRKDNWTQPQSRHQLQKQLIDQIFGGFPNIIPTVRDSTQLEKITRRSGTFERKWITTEQGVELELQILSEKQPIQYKKNTIIVLGEIPNDFDAPESECSVLCSISPRGTGFSAWPAADAVNCEDYLLAQGSNVLGRPIMGQWVWDALQAQAYFKNQNPAIKTAFFGDEVMGLAAIFAGALSDECVGVGASNILASYVWSDRFDDRWGLAHFIPNIMRFGDIAHIVAAIPPRPLVIGEPRNGAGHILQRKALQTFTERIVNSDDSRIKRTFINPELTPGKALEKLVQLVDHDVH